MADKFGMMSQAYFKGKRELLQWSSNFLQMDIPKVESLATGAHYCQFLDALNPGSIKMGRVNFGAYLEEHYVSNWKLIQIAFDKQGIQKLIPVQRLVKARFQDNLEFLQWFHQYFQSSYHGDGYDPIARRKRCKGADKVTWKGETASRGGSGSQPAARRREKTSRTSSRTTAGVKRVKPNSGFEKTTTSSRACGEKIKREMDSLKDQKNALQDELQRISKTAKEIETERDFYFGILLKVETLCKESPNANHPDIQKIREILYASNDSPRPSAAAEANPQAGEPPSQRMASEEASEVDLLGQGEPLCGMDDMVEG